jgi:PIN domain nuclease of toxin-antitoxin system
MHLVDTHTLLWANSAPELLSAPARRVIESKQIKVSVVSFWELMLKRTKKDAPLADPVAWWERYITRASIEALPVRVGHIAQLDTLPDLHKDPFDRMLIAQAAFEDLPIVTADTAIAQYSLIRTVWK